MSTKKTLASPASGGRVDVVFIRKSSGGQDEGGQKKNVKNLLREIRIDIPEKWWFECKVPRSKVQANVEFIRLRDLVAAGKVGTVYIESQDRWGTANVAELFTLLGFLAEHGTRLYDLRERTDLTETDESTEIRAFLGGLKSAKERKDISYRSLRTRVGNFKETGTWPTGPHPFGYGKACFSADGKRLWVWQPTSRTLGQTYFDKGGKLIAGPENVKIPRKEKLDRNVLVPSNYPAHVKTVRLIFELFTKVGFSRRKICKRLNDEGRKYYDRPFTHSLVGLILQNPAYVGDTHFGKSQTGELHTFDNEGLLVAIKRKSEFATRPEAERIVKKDTHEGLIDRKTWALACRKLECESERTSFSPRNPAYYLKQLLVCGHCGKNMTGRMEGLPGHKKPIYVCSSYIVGRTNGQETECGYHRISHDDAERMLLAKIEELGLEYDQSKSEAARGSVDRLLERLDSQDREASEKLQQFLTEGVQAFSAYMQETLGSSPSARVRLKKDIPALRKSVEKAEKTAMLKAQAKLTELKEEHANYTRSWAKASELQQSVLKSDIDALEAQISEWQERATPLRDRFGAIFAEDTARHAERSQLKSEWPSLDAREKGESLRRLFERVTLRWDRQFIPSAKKPARERKTDRKGRFRYTLNSRDIGWELHTSNLSRSS